MQGDNKISSIELFDRLFENNEGKPFEASDAISIIRLVAEELTENRTSGFLSYCISVWNNSSVAEKGIVPVDLSNLRGFSVDSSSIFKGARSFGTRDAYIWISLIELYFNKNSGKGRLLDYYLKNKHLMLNKNGCTDCEGKLNYKVMSISKILEATLSPIEEKIEKKEEEKPEILLNDNKQSAVSSQQSAGGSQQSAASSQQSAGGSQQVAENKLIIEEIEKEKALSKKMREEAELLLKEAKEAREGAIRYFDEQAKEIEKKKKEIIEKTEEECSKYREEQKKLSEMRQDESSEHYHIDRTEIKDGITQAREELNKINFSLGKIIDSVQAQSIDNIYRQYSYLYFTICDIHSFYSQQNDVQAKKFCNNLESFMEIIEESLAEYGILAIRTNEGSMFQGKFHKVAGADDFNPKSSVIKKSLRAGFIWDDVVKEKELVEIEDISE